MEVPVDWSFYLNQHLNEFFIEVDFGAVYKFLGVHCDCGGFYWEFQKHCDGSLVYLPITDNEYPEDYSFERLW